MSPSKIQESVKRLIGLMIETYTGVLDIDIARVSSTTFKGHDLKRGFEADKCYYLQNAGAVRDKDAIDLSIDLPPDLAIEVDISRSGMNKLGIYAALRIPEVWRCDGQAIRVFTLQASGENAEGQRSTLLPDLSLTKLVRFLNQRASASETQLIREFRAWVVQLAPDAGGTGAT